MADGGAPKGLSSKLEKKRKRQADETTKQDKPETAPAAPAAADGPSKKKRKKAKKDKKQPEQDVKTQDRKDGIDESIGKMDGRLLADYFVQRAKKLNKELSAVELNDLSVPGKDTALAYVSFFAGRSGTLTVVDTVFLDTSSFTEPRTLEKLPDFVKAFSPKGTDLSKSSEEKGTPHTLVVSAAGLRAADVVR